MAIDLSTAMSPKQVAELLSRACGSVVAERAVRERARKIGACRIIGKAMTILPDDLNTLLEDMRPTSGAYVGPEMGRRTLQGAGGGGYEALVKLREKQEREAKKRK